MNGVKGCGSSALLIMWAEAQRAMFDLRWMIALCLFLIIADFYWGTKESRMHFKEAEKVNDRAVMERSKFHFSRAGRRSLNKFVDYITYLLAGCLIGLAITEPVFGLSHVITSAVGLGAGCLFDLCSIVGHVFVLHNIETHLSKESVTTFILRSAANILKHKNRDIGEALDETISSELKVDNYGEDDNQHPSECDDGRDTTGCD
jgi:hypothetical protein